MASVEKSTGEQQKKKRGGDDLMEVELDGSHDAKRSKQGRSEKVNANETNEVGLSEQPYVSQ